MKTQDIRHAIGHRLRTLRKKHGLTQEEVARRAKCSLHFVQVLESKNPSSVSVVVLEKISQVFGMEPWEFLKFND